MSLSLGGYLTVFFYFLKSSLRQKRNHEFTSLTTKIREGLIKTKKVKGKEWVGVSSLIFSFFEDFLKCC